MAFAHIHALSDVHPTVVTFSAGVVVVIRNGHYSASYIPRGWGSRRDRVSSTGQASCSRIATTTRRSSMSSNDDKSSEQEAVQTERQTGLA